MIINITHALWKRQADTPPEYSVTFPDWAWAVFLVDLIVLLPIYIIVSHLGSLERLSKWTCTHTVVI